MSINMSDISDETIIMVLGSMMFEISIGMADTFDETGYFFDVWENGDTELFESLSVEGLNNSPALAYMYDKLVIERNTNWMPKIEEFLADEYTYFIVVGAGHLVGEEGLIILLDEAGYTVEQL